ncbi:GntR family transcriptional regulator [Thalassovita taeanensis]|nr:FCD domain-containing protein [Thalassovita taeanensis]
MTASTQSDTVFQAVRGEILGCQLMPSQKIKIGQITDKYDVSPGAAREALSRLVAEGMVIALPQRGFSVAPISRKELNDLTDARVLIETQCLTLAMEHGDIEWESAIVSAHYKLNLAPESIASPSPQLNPKWSQAHTQFHAALVASCNNDCLLELREVLYARSERYRHWSVSLSGNPARDRDTGKEHTELMDAVLKRDVARACTLAAAHFRRTSSDLIRISDALNREIS